MKDKFALVGKRDCPAVAVTFQRFFQICVLPLFRAIVAHLGRGDACGPSGVWLFFDCAEGWAKCGDIPQFVRLSCQRIVRHRRNRCLRKYSPHWSRRRPGEKPQ